MYSLTIATDTQSRTSDDYPDLGAAHRALRKFIVDQDLYLHLQPETQPLTSHFELIRLDETPAGINTPRVVGAAILTPVHERSAVVAPYFSANGALRWINENSSKWLYGSETDPGTRYPLMVLTTAREEAAGTVAAGTSYRNAASLSDAGDPTIAAPTQHTFERLRDNACSRAAQHGRAPLAAAALAGTVEQLLGPEHTAAQVSALIWYYALILWGGTESWPQ